jgi:hypothetical protein
MLASVIRERSLHVSHSSFIYVFSEALSDFLTEPLTSQLDQHLHRETHSCVVSVL